MPKVTVIKGDGVGPEVVTSAIKLVNATGAQIEWEFATAGDKAFSAGIETGVPKETIESISANRIVLKGPLATPIGFGQKSANVTLRKFFETFANIRPAKEIPGIKTPFSNRGIDLVIVRENIEDLYAGIEHMQTPDVAQCLKLISRMGSQRIAHAAFSWATSAGYKRVTAASKANIMKLSEGLFKKEFEKVAEYYPELNSDHLLVDNAAHQLVIAPEKFGVLVTTNMNGDILSDLASGLVGGLGVAASANIGYEVKMFEAVHGTAPDIAGKNIANPTAMILSSVMMLKNLEFFSEAQSLETALFEVLKSGKQTADLKPENPIGTQEFTDLILERIIPSKVESKESNPFIIPKIEADDVGIHLSSRSVVGADIFIEIAETPDNLAAKLLQLTSKTNFNLQMISNRGTQVWPKPEVLPSLIDHFRCRFIATNFEVTNKELISLISTISTELNWMHVEKLQMFNDEMAFTRAQGQN